MAGSGMRSVSAGGEREGWRALWAEVERLREKVAGGE